MHENSIIRQIVIACAFVAASQIVSMPSATAEVLNLKCVRDDEPSWLVYWIDLAKGTMARSSANAQGIIGSVDRDIPVRITPEAFEFKTGLGSVTVDRTTGVNRWPRQDPFLCSKGMLPLPARPATRF